MRASWRAAKRSAQIGKYYEAIQEYQRALDVQPTNSLAHFRMGEAMFYQKNYQAAANAFRSALGGDLDPKWTEVWSHIYIGKIYDLLGQRERAVNEYSLAQHTNDDTAGSSAGSRPYYMKRPTVATTRVQPRPQRLASGADSRGTGIESRSRDDEPTLKRRDPSN